MFYAYFHISLLSFLSWLCFRNKLIWFDLISKTVWWTLIDIICRIDNTRMVYCDSSEDGHVLFRRTDCLVKLLRNKYFAQFALYYYEFLRWGSVTWVHLLNSSLSFVSSIMSGKSYRLCLIASIESISSSVFLGAVSIGSRGRPRGHASQTHDHLKKSCESCCRRDSVFRRWQ